MNPRASKSSPNLHKPAIDPNSDTGRNLQAVADAAAARTLEGAGDIFTPPVAGLTAAECKENAREVVEHYHREHCPARGLREEVSDMKDNIAGINVAVVKIETKMNTAVGVLVAVSGALFALALAIGGAGWAIYKQTRPTPSAHSSVVLDADVPAGPSFSLIPSANAAVNP